MDRGGSTYFYNYDGLGSATEVTDDTGALVENYTYDAFGNITSSLSSIGNPYYFTGRRLDEESGIYYYRARQYDPTIGRFLQRDPLGMVDSTNLYQYAHNNPINFIDPDGEQALEYITTIGLIGVTAYVGYTVVRDYFASVLEQLNRDNGFTQDKMEDLIQDALIPPFVPDLTPEPDIPTTENQQQQEDYELDEENLELCDK